MSSEKNKSDKDFEDALDLLVPGVKVRAKLLFQIGEELSKESDRGCALVAAAYLENEITDLLKGFFVEQGAKATKELFDFNGPVGTFSSKIKMAYAIGLISSEAQIALNIIRNLRNDFAHLHEPLSFDTPNIKQRTSQLLPGTKPPEGSNQREAFIIKIQSLASSIHLCIANTLNRRSPSYEPIALQQDAGDHELEIAARRMMEITAPEITYEQALDMAKSLRNIK